MKRICLFIGFLYIAIPFIHAQPTRSVKFADALQSNMVLQQNKPLKVWGNAIAGQSVIIKADWLSNETIVVANKDSSFLAILQMPPAKENDFSKHIMSLESNGEKVVLTNLLIGDVWFCSGQSNMQFSMKGVNDSTKEIAGANYPNIRILNSKLNFSASPINNFNGNWEECTPETIKKFSAVEYYFGKALFNQLHIPIGLIFSGIGASTAQAFVPQNWLAADTMLNRVYLQPYLNSNKSKEIINGGFSFEKVIRPFLLYNAMINPFINLSIKGFCWYQGESNRTERESYTHLSQVLIKSWRQNFAQDNLPFYYVQIAPFFYDHTDFGLADCAFFREAQEHISQLENTEMVVTMDVGEGKNLHPINKEPVGTRLAKTALNRTYGKLEISYKGPQYKYLEVRKHKSIVHYNAESIGSGLQTKDGKGPAFFTIAGANRIFYPAKTTIINNTVMLTSSKVKNPVAVRYAFTNYPVTNLENKEGLPALPFRTDNWLEIPGK